MPCFRRLLLSLVIVTAFTGCSGPVGDRFVTNDLKVSPETSRINVRLDQNLKLSELAERAILNGVPLILELKLELRDSLSLTPLSMQTYRYEIRYLPMSERYQLSPVGTDTDTRLTYPRLRHALQALSRLSLSLDTPTLAAGDYELRARMRLDRASLPGPVQLPALIFGGWQHDTDWTQWPFRISV